MAIHVTPREICQEQHEEKKTLFCYINHRDTAHHYVGRFMSSTLTRVQNT